MMACCATAVGLGNGGDLSGAFTDNDKKWAMATSQECF